MSEVLRLEGVVKAAADGRRLADGISLAVFEGEHVRIRGEPGECRTALMRLIAGMDRPDFGSVAVLGTALGGLYGDAAAAFRGRAMGVCLRAPSLLPALPLWENVALPLTIRGAPKEERRKAAEGMLGKLGVAYCAQALPAALTHYERKLAALARALVASPKLLLLEGWADDLTARQADDAATKLAALAEFRAAAALLFSSSVAGPPEDRQFTLEHGRLTEVHP